ncbi:MAG TPA: BON domain-containing protein [Burkholderiales bacterium]|nr:BON domain-containing protein [Burkholderiales bacterium]
MSVRLNLLAVALGACLALAALHAKAAGAPRADDFAALDTNHDGYLSRSEAAKTGFGRAFEQGDTNHDGRLDRDEFVKAGANYDRVRIASYVDDSMITTKVKAKLVAEEKLKGFQIGVETDHGRVLLSGFVDSPKLRERALQIASKVEGVLDVRNAIVVR